MSKADALIRLTKLQSLLADWESYDLPELAEIVSDDLDDVKEIIMKIKEEV